MLPRKRAGRTGVPRLPDRAFPLRSWQVFCLARRIYTWFFQRAASPFLPADATQRASVFGRRSKTARQELGRALRPFFFSKPAIRDFRPEVRPIESENRHKVLRRALFICLFLSALVILNYLAKTKPSTVIAAFARLNPLLLLLTVAAVLGSWALEGLRVYLIADILEERLSLWRLVRINIATAFSGNVVPMASMAAPPTQVFLLHREGVAVGKATAIVAVRTAASTLFFTISAPILFLGFGRSFVHSLTTNIAVSALIELVLIVSSAVALITLGILLRPELGARLTNAAFALRPVRRILGAQSGPIAERVARESREFHQSLTSLFQKPRDTVMIALLTVLYWGLYFSIGPMLLLGVGFHLTVRGTVKLIVFLFLAYFLLSYLPIPTGSGVSELSFGSILLFFGIPDPFRTVILVVWSFLCVQIYTLLGGIFFLGSLRRHKQPPPEAVIAADSPPEKD